MADILDGTSEHHHFAPLSTQQTRAICKHLQELVEHLQHKVQGFERDKIASDGFAAHIRKDLAREQARTDELKRSLAVTQMDVEACKKDISQNQVNSQKFRSDLEEAKLDISDLRGNHSKIDLLAQSTANCLSQNELNVRQLEKTLESRLQPDLEWLREDQTKNDHATSQLKEMLKKTNSDTTHLLENVRGTQAMACGIAEDVTKRDAHLDKFGNREGDLDEKLHDTQRTGLMKLQDDQVRTAALVADLQHGMQFLSDDAKRQSDHLGHHSRHVGLKQEQLDRAVGDLNTLRNDLKRVESAMQNIRAAQDLMVEKNRQMVAQLEQTEQIARETQKGLSQTNAVVLPNLAMDPHVSTSTEFRVTPTDSPKGAIKEQKANQTMRPGSLSQGGNMIVAGGAKRHLQQH